MIALQLRGLTAALAFDMVVVLLLLWWVALSTVPQNDTVNYKHKQGASLAAKEGGRSIRIIRGGRLSEVALVCVVCGVDKYRSRAL